MSDHEIAELEAQIFNLNLKLQALKKTNIGAEVENYAFSTLEGQTDLRALFGHHKHLLVIHNMGQGCRYCTLWADGFNGLLPHLESALSVVLVSKDTPEQMRLFANSRNWRFRLASHGGGRYLEEQSVQPGTANMPGAVVYERDGDQIHRKNACIFGPYDQYCSLWNLLGLAGIGEDTWTPQYSYWRRPEQLDDGGENLLE
jgi:predicted dithiol-disulfide oxidoreductase (DUF899 family)